MKGNKTAFDAKPVRRDRERPIIGHGKLFGVYVFLMPGGDLHIEIVTRSGDVVSAPRSVTDKLPDEVKAIIKDAFERIDAMLDKKKEKEK